MQKTHHICGYFIVVFMTTAILLSVLALPKALRETPISSFSNILKGQWTRSFEGLYDKELAHYEPSVNTWGTLGYALFKEGSKGVLIGQSGWLYTNEEFEHPQGFENQIEKNLKYIQNVKSILDGKNIKLLIVPVPAKARVYPENLRRYEYPSYWREQYQDFLGALQALEIEIVDTLDALRSSKNTQLFLKTDTHWTPEGARIVALIAAEHVARTMPYLSFETTEFKSTFSGKEIHEGDLMRYVSLGNMQEAFDLRPDQISKAETQNISEASIDDLFDDISIPITLVGTSYSANPLWNFDGFLREAFQADVLNAADEGLGPFKTMEKYLMDDAFKSSPPKLLIWEIPERFLPIDYDLKS